MFFKLLNLFKLNFPVIYSFNLIKITYEPYRTQQQLPYFRERNASQNNNNIDRGNLILIDADNY